LRRAALFGTRVFGGTIFGNGGDPYLPENDAALDVLHWTGHSGCVILAPHLVGLKKRDLGLPHYDAATQRQRRDGMCWRDEGELYNDGGAFKVACRDQRGVMVTIIADNYFGYCKKEVKTQISFAANLTSDSATLSPFYIQAMKGNTMADLNLDYLEGQRESLKIRYADPELFIKSFVVNDSLFADLVSRLEAEKDTSFNKEDIASAAFLLKNQIKANIGRDLFDQAVYFRVLLDQDPWMRKVGDMMNEGKVFSYLGEK